MAESKAETQQAFRSLIESVTKIDSDASGPKSSLSPEALQRLTERLSEIVGIDAVNHFTPQRNERGELVNEEGLPIIDITEPIGASELPQSEDVVIVDHDPIVRLDQVAPPTRERLRQQRDRLLDMLEAEEREETERVKAKEKEEYEEIARRRAQASASEKDRLKAAKEMQKRMGKALIRNMVDSKTKAELEKEARIREDEEEEARRKANSSVKKKNVSFAPEVVVEDKEEIEWGDVVPAKLKPSNRPTLMSGQSDCATMKSKVVERIPTKTPASPHPVVLPEGDSDDESGEEEEPFSPSLSDASDIEAGALDEETDLNFAALQRQIQLEYHAKRETIGQAAALAAQELAEKPEDVPAQKAEDSLGFSVGDQSKPVISKFRANKLASAYGASNPSTTSTTSDSIVPASTVKTIQKSIRTGKLDEAGKLIGGENDSESEAEDEGMQEVLELLKKGEVYNLGPNGEYLHTIPPPSNPNSSSANAEPTATSSALRLDSSGPKTLPPLATKTVTSRFKIARNAAGRSSDLEGLSPSPTPVNHLFRSSPKSATRSITPDPSVNPSLPTSGSSAVVNSSSFTLPTERGLSNGVAPAFSMIVDSPSFPRPGNGSSGAPLSTKVKERSRTAIASTVREAKAIPKSQVPASTIVDSPSFPPPTRSSSRPDRPPTVLSTVRETRPKPDNNPPTAPALAPPEKVSRFKRERM